jgi:dipeptidyl-peptidase 4
MGGCGMESTCSWMRAGCGLFGTAVRAALGRLVIGCPAQLMILCLLAATVEGRASGHRPHAGDAVEGGTDSDYAKAKAMPSAIRGLVARERVEVHWREEERLQGERLGGERRDRSGAQPTTLWYEVDLGRVEVARTGEENSEGERWREGRAWVRVDLTNGTKRPLFDHAAVAESLRARGFQQVDERTLPIRRVQMVANGILLLVRQANRSVVLHWTEVPSSMLRDATAEESASFEVALESQLRRSRRQGGREVFLTFANDRDDDVTLAWIDADGQRRDYGTIAGGASREQHTFAGHAWALFAADGTLVGSLRAPDWPARVRIPAAEGEASSEPRSHPLGSPASPAPTATAPARPSAAVGVSTPSPAASIDAAAEGPTIRVTGWNVEVVGEDGSLLVTTTDGTESLRYTEPFLWSPDRSKVAITRRAPAQERTVHIVESTPRDQLQPKLRSFNYLKPGDRIEQTWPVIIDVAARRVVPSPDRERLTPNPWSIDRLAWSADGRELSFVYNERGHRVMRVLAMDAESGAMRAIINEECATFFDYAGKFLFHRLASRGAILWMSERDGWNHLYLIDAASGDLRRQLTSGRWVVRSIERIDEERGEIWFMAGGVHAD